MEIESTEKYVVSADIYRLMESWARQNGFVLPPKDLFASLRREFIIPLICAGIGVRYGIKRIEKITEVECVRIYESVIDEVCERGFYSIIIVSE